MSYSPVTQDHATDKHLLAKRLRREMTCAERKLWKALRTNQLQTLHFRRQQPILGFVVDFYCHQLRLVLEVDGPYHNDVQEYDRERDEVLRASGMTILRFTNDQVIYDLASVLKAIRSIYGLT